MILANHHNEIDKIDKRNNGNTKVILKFLMVFNRIENSTNIKIDGKIIGMPKIFPLNRKTEEEEK